MLISPQVRALIRLAIEEDLSHGDLTSDLSIPLPVSAKAEILSKEGCIICGLPLIGEIISEFGYPVEIKLLKMDGARVKKGEVLARLSGDVRHLLICERIILNFLQRLSGVATYTRRFVDASRKITILDTRKTMPGWRVLEKYAVRVGGGTNHRMHLGDGILIKNNHIDASPGGIENLLRLVQQRKPFGKPIEIEVRSLNELREALKGKPDIVMLDNMNDREIKNAIALLNKEAAHVKVEISGGVTLQRVKNLGSVGVKYVSVGALTTKATNVDISMRVRSHGK